MVRIIRWLNENLKDVMHPPYKQGKGRMYNEISDDV